MDLRDNGRMLMNHNNRGIKGWCFAMSINLVLFKLVIGRFLCFVSGKEEVPGEWGAV